MKKIKVLMLAVIAMASTGVFAQSSPWWFEGQLGVNYTSLDDALESKETNFNIGFGANYKLSNAWSVGANLTYSYWKEKDTYSEDNGNMFYIAPQVVYTKPMWGRMSWTPAAQLLLGFGDETVIGFGFDLLAFDYKISQKWALNIACDLGTVAFVNVEDAGSNFNFQLGKNSSTLGDMGFRFGFRYYL